MAKMNWDRVRAWDKVRGELTHTELADERDEQWFAREMERDDARNGARSPLPQKPLKPTAAPQPKAPPKAQPETQVPAKAQHALSNAAKRRARHETIARSIGVTGDELRAAIANESLAGRGLEHKPKAERARLTARRLGITPPELSTLRQAFAGNAVSKTIAGSLVRKLAKIPDQAPARANTNVDRLRTKTGRDGTTVVAGTSRAQLVAPDRSQPKPAKPRPAPTPAKSSPAQPASHGGRTIYVTPHGDVVHLVHDCSSMRGFRGTREADPDVYKTDVRDPCCVGRRICGTCKNNLYAIGKSVEQELLSFHGPPVTDYWDKKQLRRPKPSGQLLRGR
ncbi:MAG: hypothetical protein Q8K63_11230 [Acidimicrobiales bacterium]|nr:hypothetical protein [Acidimicrobiales bacterium]